MEARSERRRRSSSAKGVEAGRQFPPSIDLDILPSIFLHLDPLDLARCCLVSKSWKDIIYNSMLLANQYYSKRFDHAHSSGGSSCLNASLKNYLSHLALEQHTRSLTSDFAVVRQWNAHSVGFSHCMMKMGLIVTGVGDKVLRLWSAENCKCLQEFHVPFTKSLIDFDFDETKIVGLIESRICIWKRHGGRSLFPSKDATFIRGLCMRYMDPEAVVGCGDGTARIFDMYGQSCSRIIKMHQGPISCLTVTDDQMVISGSTLGSISIAGLSCGEDVGILKSASAGTGIRTLCYNPSTYQVFAGSTSGHAHSWDIRTMKLLWETRPSPNVVYSMQHMLTDTSALVVGGVDGVLRIINQGTGKTLARYVLEKNSSRSFLPDDKVSLIKRSVKISEDVEIGRLPLYSRPPIICLAVGWKKVVTCHNGRFIRLWKFNTQTS